MAISDLFHPDLVIGSFCGGCSRSGRVCKDCSESTMRANGLPVEEAANIEGLPYPPLDFEHSIVRQKIDEIKRKLEEQTLTQPQN